LVVLGVLPYPQEKHMVKCCDIIRLVGFFDYMISKGILQATTKKGLAVVFNFDQLCNIV